MKTNMGMQLMVLDVLDVLHSVRCLEQKDLKS